MKFSISTSFYRRNNLVETLYKQLQDQTHTDWEWIVTDDFSDYNNAKEQLIDICANDSRVKYYEQSRKKECFYNPQRGTTGEIVIQLDSDDYAYPKILEVYNHLFLKHPEVMGMSSLCDSRSPDGEFIEIQGACGYVTGQHPTFNLTPMARAWRNTIHSFDEGEMDYFQNDTNIVRHCENMGKWLWIPRTFYQYYYSHDTFSRLPGRNSEDFTKIEVERQYIENKFPHLHDDDKCSLSLYYQPIYYLARDFSLAEFNKANTRKKLLYVKEGLKPSERALLKELFFDHDLYFDYKLNIKFDEIFISLSGNLINYIDEINNTLKMYNINTPIKMRYQKSTDYNLPDVHNIIHQTFGNNGWHTSGFEIFFISAV
jgi:glycosyltransferase involved in cell wall biosynthesis